MLELLQEIKGTLRRNMMRTIATGFAVVSGLFLLIVLRERAMVLSIRFSITWEVLPLMPFTFLAVGQPSLGKV